MPRAPKRCSRLGCKALAPCPEHPRGWAGHQSVPLPSNWKQLVKRVLARQRCAYCGAPGTEVDHIVNRAEGGGDDISNLQLLCSVCHTQKTQEESKRGNKRRKQ